MNSNCYFGLAGPVKKAPILKLSIFDMRRVRANVENTVQLYLSPAKKRHANAGEKDKLCSSALSLAKVSDFRPEERFAFRLKQKYETLAPVGMPRFPTLDGWRGMSILLVLMGHLFPLGPPRFQANASFAAFGMAIFFTLSGFLITTTLLYRPSVGEFLIRRLCRIVPLAWAFSLVALTIAGVPASVYVAQLLFYSNLPPFWLTTYTGHLWSLGVEVQFYLSMAIIFLLFKRRGLMSLPFLCLAVTSYRIYTHTTISIVTTQRVDEILAGACLALVAYYPQAAILRRVLRATPILILLLLAFASSCEQSGPLGYARPYLVAALVGTTLFRDQAASEIRPLQTRWLVYLAAISYALYILHPIVSWGWLASGSKLVKYAKRMPELAVVFGLAHLSTFYYEAFWIRLGKQWSKRWTRRSQASLSSVLSD